VEAQVSNGDRMLSLSPQAAYELNNRQRDYENLKEQYQSIRDRQLEAQVAANLEAEEKGERFTLVEASSMPDEPVRPNRPMIVLFGLLAGIGVGLASVLALELFTKSIYSPSAMAELTGAPPLSILPMIRLGAAEPKRSFLQKLSMRFTKRRNAL
jgi:uncharacterized protein involved in exopolysaccharide biosynthesis